MKRQSQKFLSIMRKSFKELEEGRGISLADMSGGIGR